MELGQYDERGCLKLSGPLVILSSEMAMPFGMALHELSINAVRHGAPGHPDGRLQVTWALEGTSDGLVLHWTWNEHGGPPVAIPTCEGFGSRVLRKVLTIQAGARFNVAYHPDVMRVSISAPLRTSGP
ncbi:sensor histidine kinase [Methylobacterium sp. V23]|uniref:sensor histidine kinase n=1 Tax=Methylobacterium sp. V23 TaxID=2044878 RepID=UPI000CDB76C3|nr:sensor histidine kinase [Methylobacterium sp. V23]POR40136.1 hypothetical protein CRT23_25530 [Methylobacterium sp. V23]